MHVGTSASRDLVIDDTTTVLRDRTFIEEMKFDILRRAEEPSDSKGKSIYLASQAITLRIR